MANTRSNQETAKSKNPRAAQDEAANSRKLDWWLISSLMMVVTSVVGLAYTLWK
jgi:hypothetical protein